MLNHPRGLTKYIYSRIGVHTRPPTSGDRSLQISNWGPSFSRDFDILLFKWTIPILKLDNFSEVRLEGASGLRFGYKSIGITTRGVSAGLSMDFIIFHL